MELKLPPGDAYHKLMHTIEEVNMVLSSAETSCHASRRRLSPELGNVCFASSQHGWCFSLFSFAKVNY